MSILPQYPNRTDGDSLDRLRVQLLVVLIVLAGCLITFSTLLPALGVRLVGTEERNVSRDLVINVFFVLVSLLVIVQWMRTGTLSRSLQLLFIASSVSVVLAFQYFNGTLTLTAISLPSLLILMLYSPRAYVLMAGLGYITALYLIQHYVGHGVHEHSIDRIIFQALLIILWPLITLVRAAQPWLELKATMAKQLFLASAVVVSVFSMVDVDRQPELLVNAAISLLIWFLIRKALVLTLPQRVGIILIVLGGFGASVISLQVGSLFVIPASVLLIFICLPRFWATILSLSLVVLATLSMDLFEGLVVRGVTSALIFILLVGIWFNRTTADVAAEFKWQNLLGAILLGTAHLLFDLSPLLTGSISFDSQALAFRTVTIDLIQYLVLVWLIYEVLCYIQQSYIERSRVERELDNTFAALEIASEVSELGLLKMNLVTGEIDINARYAEIFDLSDQEHLTLEVLMSRTHPDDRARVEAWATQYLQSHESTESEHRLWVRGEVRHIHTRAIFKQDQHGNPVVYAAVQDVTEQVRKVEELQFASERFELALNVSGLAVFEIDLETERSTLFAGSHFLLHQQQSLDLTEFATQYIPSAHEREAMLAACRSDNGSAEYAIIDPALGRPRWSRIRTGSRYLRDGRYKRLSVRLDVTNERESLEKLREAQQQQRELFAVLGHGLRTPVAAIDMTLSDESTSDREKIASTKELSASLLDTLEDLRTVIAPDRARETRRISAVPEQICKRAIEALSEMVAEAGIAVHFSADPQSSREYLILHQPLRKILTNLLKHATLYTQAQNIWVNLSTENDQLSGANLCLSVEDDGVGLSEAEQDKLFDRFSHATTKTDGSALGLYIVSELAKVLSGVIVYRSRAGGGSRFVLHFPAELSSQEPFTARVETGYQLAGMRILLAEDDKVIRMLSEKLLMKAKAEVSIAENGQQALELYPTKQWDLVLTDILMPVVDGYDLCKALRSEGYRGPIIGVTAAVAGLETERLIEAGADAVLSKPIRMEQLKFALAQFKAKSDDAAQT